MPLYEYDARDSGGGLLTSRMEAASPAVVAAKLAEAGMTPVSIEPIQQRGEVSAGSIRLPGHP